MLSDISSFRGEMALTWPRPPRSDIYRTHTIKYGLPGGTPLNK